MPEVLKRSDRYRYCSKTLVSEVFSVVLYIHSLETLSIVGAWRPLVDEYVKRCGSLLAMLYVHDIRWKVSPQVRDFLADVQDAYLTIREEQPRAAPRAAGAASAHAGRCVGGVLCGATGQVAGALSRGARVAAGSVDCATSAVRFDGSPVAFDMRFLLHAERLGLIGRVRGVRLKRW